MPKDVDNRIKAAHASFGRLAHRVFNNHGLTIKTKIMVFRAVVLSTLLYACETWTLYRRDIRRLERFQQSKLRGILRIRWQDRITNNEVLLRASLPSIEASILQHRLRWAGHIHRMDSSRLPRRILYGELAGGRRTQGAPKRRFKDQLKETLNLTGIEPSTSKKTAEDQNSWRQAVRMGTNDFEKTSSRRAEAKRLE